ncbi:MAG: hypothetical protein JWN93_1612 [Hyphomicrobiales bacterium]|nr:hypothetical protein [Hyphomicrobiales bacterium]
MLDSWTSNPPEASAAGAPEGPKLQQRSGGRGKTIAVVLALLLAVAGGAHLWRGAQVEAPAPVVAPKPDTGSKSADSVTVAQMQARQLVVAPAQAFAFSQQRMAIGQIAFNEDASTVVVAPFSGRVIKVLAKIGEDVKRGAPLFEIESPEVSQAHTDLIAAALAVDKSHAQMALAKRVLDRQSGLLAERATSQREVDQARNEMASAELDLKTAQGGLLGARNKLRVLTGHSEKALATIQEQRIVSGLLTVASPIDGTVVARKIGPGQFVRSDSGDALYTISDLSTMWLKASVPENEVRFVQVGHEAEVRLNAMPERVFKARISAVGAASDAVTHRVVVRSELDNPDRVLRPEMFASFRIFTGAPTPALAVPVEAVIREASRSFVWVEEKPLTYRRRKVVIGSEQDGRVEIREGLEAGERVVGKGAIFVDNEWKQ